jgi:hypothetical protein
MPADARKNDTAPADPALPLVGRERELRALSALLRRGSRALVLGPRGSGKTRLAAEACAACGLRPIAAHAPAALHALLEQIYCELFPAESLAAARRIPGRSLQARVLGQLRLRPRWLWIDDPSPADPRLFRFLERMLWIDGCGLLVTATSRAGLGRLASVLWDQREQVLLRPLSRAASEQLLEEAIRAFGLEALGPLGDFRAQALEAAAGLPGRLVTLCRLAARPEYRREGRLLFAPLWIDTLTRMA